MTQIYINQTYTNIRQNFQRISPFGITPVEKAHKARTRWYRGPTGVKTYKMFNSQLSGSQYDQHITQRWRSTKCSIQSYQAVNKINISHRGEDIQTVQYRASYQAVNKIDVSHRGDWTKCSIQNHQAVQKEWHIFWTSAGFFCFFYPLMEKGLNFKQSKNGWGHIKHLQQATLFRAFP